MNGFQNYEDEYNNRTASLNYRQINSNYIAENIPAIKEEDYVDNIKIINLLFKMSWKELVILNNPSKIIQ